MENIFIIAGIISIIYIISKFIEMRFVDKENKPLKLLIRDTVLVYFSVILGYFIIDQLKPIGISQKTNPTVFTDNPEF
jgi:hypothetical protein